MDEIKILSFEYMRLKSWDEKVEDNTLLEKTLVWDNLADILGPWPLNSCILIQEMRRAGRSDGCFKLIQIITQDSQGQTNKLSPPILVFLDLLKY